VQQGQASGVYNTIRELASDFGVAVLGAIVQAIASAPILFVDSFRAALFVGAAVLVARVALTALLRGRAGASQAISDAVAEAA
jgi:hypothetical protein